MKIMLLSTIFPYPVDVGKKVVLSGLIRFFCERVGEENFYLICPNTDTPAFASAKFRKYTYAMPSEATRIVSVIKYGFLLRSKSIQESIFFSNRIKSKLQQAINDVQPDLVVFDTVRMGQYLPHLDLGNAAHVLYLDDLFSVRYEVMLQATKNNPSLKFNALGNFEKNIPGFLRPYVKKISRLQSILLSIESKKIRHSEIQQSRRFPLSLLINKAEARMLRQWSGSRVEVLPPLLSTPERAYARTWSGSAVFVFLGGLDVPHNAVSIENFVEQQLPKIVQAIPDVLIRIIGKNPSSRLVELVAKNSRYVVIEGYVENLGEVLNAACAMLVPLLFGSGVKLKTIDAMAFGIPILSSDYGVEGVDAPDDETTFIRENDLQRYSAHMKNLLEPEYNSRLSHASFDFYSLHYAEAVVKHLYTDIFAIR
ncbi:glycosyltransferase involved in cell wall biosynthesis [Duganella sp. 3397]|uniref:glycosyltransferase family 4 protein n=1 Tax=Duganella sp. 3397 TaxID=2817732 RepID=UPI00286192EB|nr:glycosyltransferase family 4 protein [Duganella sp. 3397]MDR7052278.1 glycosyltransferase involved in cell wall biosynthesis [Duganella sp. 3397]